MRTVYGGVATQEILELLSEIEQQLVELKRADENDYIDGVKYGLHFSYKKLMNMIYEDEYCKRMFKELEIE